MNHYHLLVYVHDFQQLGSIFQKIHGSTSYQWNLEDKQRGRKPAFLTNSAIAKLQTIM